MDESHVALHQHLGHTGCTAKVTVNLERRVSVPKVVQRTVLQQVPIELIGPVTVMEACPLVELLAHAPTGSTVTAMVQHHL